MQHYEPIRELLDRVRARWRALCALQALVRGALIAAAVLGVAVLASRWTTGAPVVLMLLAAAALLLAAGALTWCLAPLRRVPADGKVARFIEERTPSLDDRLVTAVDVAQRRTTRPALAAHDARRRRARGRRTSTSTRSCRRESLRRAGFQAAAAVLALGVGAVRRARAGAAGRRRGVADAVSRARRART